MEALPISPTKANAQPATAPVSGGLSELFQALLQENTLRLDTRASILPSVSTTREAFEPGRDAGRGPRPSAVVEPESRARSTDPRSRTDDAEPVANPRPGGHEDEPAEAEDAPETPAAPITATDNGADGETEPATGGSTDPEVQTTGDDAAPAPDAAPETDETASLGLPDVAANIAAGKAQALGKDSFGAQQVLLRMAPQAQAATSATPAATPATTTPPAGPDGAAMRVQVTPAGLVAPPNAALGGGAAFTAMTAEAGQADQANQPTQAGVSAATSALNNAASSVAAAQNALRAAVRATGGGSTSNAGAGQSHNAQTGTAPAGTAPAASVTGQGSPAADIPTQLPHAQTSAPHNAQTPFSESNNTHAQNGNLPAATSANSHMPDARAANMLAQNANGPQTLTQAGLTDATPASIAEGVVSDGQRNPQALESQTRAAQSTAPDQAQNATARGPEAANAAIAASQAGNTAKAQNAQTTGQPAPAGAAQRTEGIANQGTNLPGAATVGLGQAATRGFGMLPAQARPATTQPVPVDQVAVHISKAVRAGEDRIRIRLHPAELGQIDVKLKLGADGLVKAIVSVEKPETFDLLQKDARSLERALQDAGLKTDSGSLSFHLRGENHQGTGEHGNEPEFGQLAAEPEHQTDGLTENAPPPAQVMSDYAIDIRV